MTFIFHIACAVVRWVGDRGWVCGRFECLSRTSVLTCSDYIGWGHSATVSSGWLLGHPKHTTVTPRSRGERGIAALATQTDLQFIGHTCILWRV